MDDWDQILQPVADGVVLAVMVTPRAGKTGIDRIAGGALRVKLAAPPVAGAANAALLRYLADWLDLPRSHVELIAGATSRRKRVLLRGLTAATVAARLAADRAAPTAADPAG